MVPITNLGNLQRRPKLLSASKHQSPWPPTSKCDQPSGHGFCRGRVKIMMYIIIKKLLIDIHVLVRELKFRGMVPENSNIATTSQKARHSHSHRENWTDFVERRKYYKAVLTLSTV